MFAGLSALSVGQADTAGGCTSALYADYYICNMCFDVWFDALVILPAPQLAPSACKYQKKGRDDHVALVAAIW